MDLNIFTRTRVAPILSTEYIYFCLGMFILRFVIYIYSTLLSKLIIHLSQMFMSQLYTFTLPISCTKFRFSNISWFWGIQTNFLKIEFLICSLPAFLFCIWCIGVVSKSFDSLTYCIKQVRWRSIHTSIYEKSQRSL